MQVCIILEVVLLVFSKLTESCMAPHSLRTRPGEQLYWFLAALLKKLNRMRRKLYHVSAAACIASCENSQQWLGTQAGQHEAVSTKPKYEVSGAAKYRCCCFFFLGKFWYFVWLLINLAYQLYPWLTPASWRKVGIGPGLSVIYCIFFELGQMPVLLL